MTNWKKRNDASNIEDAIFKLWGVSGKNELNSWFLKHQKEEYAIDNLDKMADFLNSYKDGYIAICGDYDCDGVMGTSILALMLDEQGFNVGFLIPERHTQGYGLNTAMVEKIKETAGSDKVCLLCVDNGIAAFEAIDLAKEYGFSVAVLDHHLGTTDSNNNIILPSADVIIDPAAMPDTAVFSSYCGAGLAYKLACHMLGRKVAAKYMPLAAVATFADVMPLKETI